MLRHRNRWQSRDERARGQVLVLFAFLLVALLAASALAVDYGGWLLARRSYQNVADAAALAGANQLTSEITDPCVGPGHPSEAKSNCAKEAAWTFLKNELHLPAGFSPSIQSQLPVTATPVTTSGYRIWVASPPSEAGAAYYGQFSTPQTIYVRVERDLPTNLGRIVHPNDTTINAWATAGRVPKNFAILTLCRPDANARPPENCLANLTDIRVNGNNSSIVIEDGDLGNNTWSTTNANGNVVGSAIALAPNSNAYMGRVDLCWADAGKCNIVGWDNATQSRTGARSAFPLGPQIVDPAYTVPTMTSTAVPWQCVDAGYNPGPIALVPVSGPMTAVAAPPMVLAAAVLPGATQAPLLGSFAANGTITDASFGGIPLAGVTMELRTSPGNVLVTSTPTLANGTYSFTNVASGSYTIVALKTNYATQTHTFTKSNTSDEKWSTALLGNPGTLSGHVYDASNVGVDGATVQVTGGGTTTTAGGGFYQILLVPAGTRTVTASKSGYTATSLTVTMPAGGPATLDLKFGASGAVSGKITDSTTGLGIGSASVQIAGQASTTTAPDGTYTLSPVAASPPNYTVVATASGYTNGSRTVTVTAGATTQNMNIALTPTGGSISGTVSDQFTSLPIQGATVRIVGFGGTTTNAAGHYSFAGVPPARYDMTAEAVGYLDQTDSRVQINAGANPPHNFMLGPSTCDRNNNNSYTKANWLMCHSGASLDCQGTSDHPWSPSGGALDSAADITCRTFDRANRITPGTYNDITIPNDGCAWIDPAPSTLTTGQLPGVVHITGNLNIGSGAFIFGDGVTVVMDTTAKLTVGNSGGFVLNFASVESGGVCNLSTVAGKDETHKCFRTAGGVNAPRPYDATACGSGHQVADYTYGAWTTKTAAGGPGPWGTAVAGTPPPYNDCSLAAGSIGMLWYLRSSGSDTYSARFSPASQYGFLFMGVLYGPRDNIGLSGQGGQASAGQIVAWTITYSGSTTIYQRYTGLKQDGPAYLLEPTLGQ